MQYRSTMNAPIQLSYITEAESRMYASFKLAIVCSDIVLFGAKQLYEPMMDPRQENEKKTASSNMPTARACSCVLLSLVTAQYPLYH